LQLALIDPEVIVDIDLQFLMTRPLALKRTVPAVETVTVMGLEIPKVRVVEEKAMVAVAEPVVMVIVAVVLSAR
jgi:hypothetical protein